MTLCKRHPANIPALIAEIEWKLEQDEFLLENIRNKLREHSLEKQSCADAFKHLKSLIKEGVESHNKLLEHRYSVKKSLMYQSIEDEKKFLAIQDSASALVTADQSISRSSQPKKLKVQNLQITNHDTSPVSSSVILPLYGITYSICIIYFHFCEVITLYYALR